MKPPRYTKCPPDDIKSEYIADSKRTTVTVSWTDPEATDDEELKSYVIFCKVTAK